MKTKETVNHCQNSNIKVVGVLPVPSNINCVLHYNYCFEQLCGAKSQRLCLKSNSMRVCVCVYSLIKDGTFICSELSRVPNCWSMCYTTVTYTL